MIYHIETLRSSPRPRAWIHTSCDVFVTFSSTTTMDKVNLASKFSLMHEHWKPHIAGELNGQLIKLVKFEGEFVWHHHDNEDEMFLVVKGQFRMEFSDIAGEGAHSTPSLHS